VPGGEQQRRGAVPEAAAALAGQALDMADGGDSIVRPVATHAVAVRQALDPWARAWR
jgi:hypothetical protein